MDRAIQHVRAALTFDTVLFFGLFLTLFLATLFQWFQFPPLPANDDALFLSRGVGNYSVVEFSPHFPGYAGLVLGVKALRGLFSNDYQALHTVVLCMTALIPVVVSLILKVLQVKHWVILAVAAILYAQPLLISVALSGLSDGPGLLVWLIALLLFLTRKPTFSALFLGIMLTVRPSYLFLFLPLFAILIWQHKRQLIPILLSIALPPLLALIYMYSKDGVALFDEAFRFIRGHFLVWGNTTLTETREATWWHALTDYVGGVWFIGAWFIGAWFIGAWFIGAWFIGTWVLISSGVVWVKKRNARSLVISFISILLWTLLFQNPDNLRHSLPIIVLGSMVLASAILTKRYDRLGSVVSTIVVVCVLAHSYQLPITSPAIQQALVWINAQPGIGRYQNVIVTNEGVELAREYQNQKRVADAWYRQQAEWLWAGGAWRMSYSPIERYGEPLAIFPSRFAGEHGTYVYRVASASKG